MNEMELFVMCGIEWCNKPADLKSGTMELVNKTRILGVKIWIDLRIIRNAQIKECFIGKSSGKVKW
jgi:hypothetical protein